MANVVPVVSSHCKPGRKACGGMLLLFVLGAACGDSADDTPVPEGVGMAGTGVSAAGGGDPDVNAGPGAAGTPPATNAGTGAPSTAGAAAPAAGTGSAAGTGASGQGGTAGQGMVEPPDAGMAVDAATDSDSGMSASGPTLPEITDPGAGGPFEVDRVDSVGGLSSHTLFVPSETNSAGKHPSVVWTCGNGGTVSFYVSFLEHLASHGFLVVADKASSSDRLAEVASQEAAIEWLVSENAKQGGDFFEKIDVDNIAVMGHSLGSLASFATAAQNAHVATSVHFSGGLTGNPVGFDESWLADMTKPAAFLCGGSDGTAGPSCELDFEQAPPSLPVFYGVLAGASHIGPFALTPRGGEYGRAGVAWLRWQLAGDPAFEAWFAGADCTLCQSPWTARQRNLE